ncbi:SAM-dependent methyltransferase [Micromonospora sp. NPDC049559]|uniref:SAM-dependent methyltransferase n=1 Tax=Micromonospora sp. NPDC049559 TaxID=3155923 RepID=UPI0034180A7E
MSRSGSGAPQERPASAIDTTVPHAARVYDWWLGGKDNFAVDRAVGAAMIEAIPHLRTMAGENRRFVHRVTRYLVRHAGIRQFLDIGTGIPTRPNLHEVAQELAPETRVVYVDNDPIVLAHARALMVSTPEGRSSYVHADLREPESILAALGDTLDLDQPVAMTLLAILMLVADADDPVGKVRALMDRLPSGSYVAITHATPDFNADQVNAAVAAATRTGATLVPRPRAHVERYFEGWEMVEPGLVPVMSWRPDGEPPADPYTAYYWAGVARKP